MNASVPLPPPPAKSAGVELPAGVRHVTTEEFLAMAREAQTSVEGSRRVLDKLGRAFRELSLVEQFQRVLSNSRLTPEDPIYLILELFSIAYGYQTAALTSHCEALGRHERALSRLTELNGQYAGTMLEGTVALEGMQHGTSQRTAAIDRTLEAATLLIGRFEKLMQGAGLPKDRWWNRAGIWRLATVILFGALVLLVAVNR